MVKKAKTEEVLRLLIPGSKLRWQHETIHREMNNDIQFYNGKAGVLLRLYEAV